MSGKNVEANFHGEKRSNKTHESTTDPEARLARKSMATAPRCASPGIRKRIEEPFGWVKMIAGGRKLRYKGTDRNSAWFKMTIATYNVIRITALDAATT